MGSMPADGVSLSAIGTPEETRESLEAGWPENQGCLHSQKWIMCLSETWPDLHRHRNKDS